MKKLVLILGPTGVGKTELSLQVAERYGCPIINCDSRQVYRDIPIGTAAPTKEEQQRVPHYLVGTKDLEENYSAGQFERDALTILEELFKTHEVAVMTGGSMLYADALCYGLDALPNVPDAIRKDVREAYETKGIAWLQAEVQRLDPDYWEQVDRSNPARLMHCVELSMTTGVPYSSLLSGKGKAESGKAESGKRKEESGKGKAESGKRPFRIVKVALNRDREELYARINRRVEQMVKDGLVEEARAVYPKRHLNSLQTGGFRELFGYFDGEYDLARAIELIQQNTRHYAKRQLTWFRRDKDLFWLDANDDNEKNISLIDALLRSDRL